MTDHFRLKQSSFLTRVVIVVLLVYMAITLLNLQSQIQDAEAQLLDYEEQIEEQEQINAQLQSDVENGTDEEELEDIARYKLGLVEPGEKVFYDITN